MKDYISYTLVSFDEVIVLKLWCIVYVMTAYYLFCKLEMEVLVFS